MTLVLLLLLQVRGCSADLEQLSKYCKRLGICSDCMKVGQRNLLL
jgi:hypothetical protein